MKIGTIFIWENYPHLLDGTIKNAWCIYLGETESFIEPVYSIFHKLTSRLYLYEHGGSRVNRQHYIFKKEKYTFLEKDSIFDFEQIHESVIKEEFINANIEPLYELSMEMIKMIYNHLIQSYCRYEYKIKCCIHECLNKEGIIGLQKPKRKIIQRPY